MSRSLPALHCLIRHFLLQERSTDQAALSQLLLEIHGLGTKVDATFSMSKLDEVAATIRNCLRASPGEWFSGLFADCFNSFDVESGPHIKALRESALQYNVNINADLTEASSLANMIFSMTMHLGFGLHWNCERGCTGGSDAPFSPQVLHYAADSDITPNWWGPQPKRYLDVIKLPRTPDPLMVSTQWALQAMDRTGLGCVQSALLPDETHIVSLCCDLFASVNTLRDRGKPGATRTGTSAGAGKCAADKNGWTKLADSALSHLISLFPNLVVIASMALKRPPNMVTASYYFAKIYIPKGERVFCTAGLTAAPKQQYASLSKEEQEGE